MTLFVAAIIALDERLTRLAHREEDDATRAALHQVRQMRRALERAGQWPAAPVNLNDLL
jgi:hypothetical protein